MIAQQTNGAEFWIPRSPGTSERSPQTQHQALSPASGSVWIPPCSVLALRTVCNSSSGWNFFAIYTCPLLSYEYPTERIKRKKKKKTLVFQLTFKNITENPVTLDADSTISEVGLWSRRRAMASWAWAHAWINSLLWVWVWTACSTFLLPWVPVTMGRGLEPWPEETLSPISCFHWSLYHTKWKRHLKRENGVWFSCSYWRYVWSLVSLQSPNSVRAHAIAGCLSFDKHCTT